MHPSLADAVGVGPRTTHRLSHLMAIVSTTAFKSRGLVFHPRFHIAVRNTSDGLMRTWPSFPPALRSTRHPPRSGVCPVQGRTYRVGDCSIMSPHAMGRHTSFFVHHIRQSSPLHCGPCFHLIGTSRCPILFHRSAKSRCAPKSPDRGLAICAHMFAPPRTGPQKTGLRTHAQLRAMAGAASRQ